MPRTTLRAVEDGEEPTPDKPAKTLLEAADRSRREFLVTARRIIAKQIDGGKVPAHALGRLIADAERLDLEIRRIDAADEEEARRAESKPERRSFDATAI